MSEALLAALNPGKASTRPARRIAVASVRRQPKSCPQVARIEVDKPRRR